MQRRRAAKRHTKRLTQSGAGGIAFVQDPVVGQAEQGEIMARVPLVDDEHLTGEARELVAGHPINLYRALAHSPGGLACFAELGQWIRFKSVLDPRQRELAILTVGVIARARYEFSHHVKIGFDFGLSEGDITDVVKAARGDASGLTGTDLLVVRAAREMTIDGAISAPTFEELRAVFDDTAVVELTLIIAHYACVTRVLESLQVDVEADYADYLTDFPFEG
jgi:alkylhydroperoxidase family enzyme